MQGHSLKFIGGTRTKRDNTKWHPLPKVTMQSFKAQERLLRHLRQKKSHRHISTSLAVKMQEQYIKQVSVCCPFLSPYLAASLCLTRSLYNMSFFRTPSATGPGRFRKAMEGYLGPQILWTMLMMCYEQSRGFL